MKPPMTLSQNISISSSPNLHHCTRRSFPPPKSPLTLGLLNRTSHIQFNLLHLSPPTPNKVDAVRFDGPVVEFEDCEVVIETCVTRTLPPALTLDHGLKSIREAVEDVKFNTLVPSNGVLRFQVAVPPSPKALKWFCCQPESSGVFPQFFLSKEAEDPSSQSLNLGRTRGVFGIGAAIFFVNSSRTSQEQRLIKRYVSSDSFEIATYGFTDIKFDLGSSSVEHEAGSFYLVIPEIELDEHEDVSLLSATLAWDDASFCTFKQAIESFESSIYQVSYHFSSNRERCCSKFLTVTPNKINLLEDKKVAMVCSNTLSLGRGAYQDDFLELKSFSQFYFRHSPTFTASSNMLLDHAGETSHSLQDCTNINAVWAFLMVEECSRLGLTYFCIAPGSRSSPLAIAASIHPHTTCIACFDERSLAFHAVGYARGSHKPAVVITSSGTAVSNLLPAVVEASQDFVPLLLLTADRPPELQGAGANQSINQVNHFGSFVRFFFSLPTSTDDIPARMVLTTLDSAVHLATSSPCGPVHINCPFREPLDDAPRKWMSDCLTGLDTWISSAEPFTKYITLENSIACDGDKVFQMSQVLEIIKAADRGLLILGAIHSEDDIWAALLLAKHLNWPVVADILSGLRLRKLLAYSHVEENVLFLDHLDHALLSNMVRGWLKFDAVIQIGSPITSKRISQMLEQCYPYSYILVTDHPYRHDPSHIVTHRLDCSILEFVNSLMKAPFPFKSNSWCHFVRALDSMVGWALSFQISAENSLTEPYVAHAISEALSVESALFIGNSMAIRDANMYGCSYRSDSRINSDVVLNSELQFLGIRVAGNRGASGIDGLLSTAIGFAVGCSKRVLCLIGDVSFLHDTNGLSIFNPRISRKPMTVIVINNHGGAIFSLLPIADRIDQRILDQYFHTSHKISIHQLCTAHSVGHLHVKTKMELLDALLISQQEKTDYIIEVESCISTNSTFHSTLRKSACQAADHALNVLSRLSFTYAVPEQFFLCKILKMEYSLYRIELGAPPTSALVDQGGNEFHKHGYILSLYLEDGNVGYGEVAPIEIHKENLLDVEEQLRYLVHVIKGTKINISLPLLSGAFSSWIWYNLGIPENSVFPSVRLGLEMAILNAIAEREGSGLLNIIEPLRGNEEIYEKPVVRICGLIDSNGTPAEVAYIASSLVEEGFSALKLKVARRVNPLDDAAVIQEIRKKVGEEIELRVDANRNWSYEEAIQFGRLVKDCDLQYIEEPVQDEDDIIKYSEESGLPVALDETVNKVAGDPLDMLAKYSHPGIVAVVIKPSVIGGFERAALIAKWAHHHGKMAVVSAAFESGLGLSTYIQFSYYLDLQNAHLCKVMNRKLQPSVAHGLGTYQWLKQDLTTKPLGIRYFPCTGFVGASVTDSIHLLRSFQINQNVILGTSSDERVCTYNLAVSSKDLSCSIKVHDIGPKSEDNVVVFLHGFLGTGEDWISIMTAISGSVRCISIDLPGHGASKMQNCSSKDAKWDATLSVEIVSNLLYKLIQEITPGKVTLVGYSLGGRIALHMALRHVDKINGAVIISGSPGLEDEMERKVRLAKDVSRSRLLIAYGLHMFVDTWYAAELWNSLRSHPRFKAIVSSRLFHDDVFGLAKVLSGLSVGGQIPLWKNLKQCSLPLLLIVGEKDRKFKAISEKMCSEIGQSREGRCEIVVVPSCGHAVHIENPLSVVGALSQFLTRQSTCLSP
ncbi:2-succinyl-5-enolpyruvyl-6-hydroxy-3-cyclohexene-1-carboxylate synthase [Euphorbia peplus]|nr:2-succinyl-5-enolpyruvyl-6-hydroxy-3-cyclohexene-1-carboxylate synthase [Euphorbia peplus]